MSPRSERWLLGLAAGVVAVFAASFFLGQTGRQADTPPPASASSSAPVPEPPRPLGRVEVLNAGDRAGLAERIARRLRERGYDVVTWGNAPADVPDRSAIVTRRGDGAIARALADLLGIDSLRTDLVAGLDIDATVVVGSAFEEGSGDT